MSRSHARLNHQRWARTRRQVLERDGYRCVRCGKAGKLEADHRVPLTRDPRQDPYNPAGCQALCRDCHLRKTAAENRRPLTPAERKWRALVAELTG
ncbi:MAG: HNH endonuclease [Rhodospirillales bacterium]|nr:HNH endonuclease [Rhodospirillales bacterium]